MTTASSARADVEAGAWAGETLEALYARLGGSPDGLSAADAAARLASHGANRVADEPSLSAARLLAHQFESPLVLILVFAALVSLLLGEWVESSIIIAIVLGSTALGFVQEYRASTAVARLRGQLALTVRALRDGDVVPVPVGDIVPGDVVVLRAGNLVPADGRLTEAADFLVSEASLTGESFPIEKTPGVVPVDTPLARRKNCVFLGTSVRSGTARVLITATGRQTALGAIAGRLRSTPPETEFARGVRQFGALLVRMMVVIVLFVLATNYALGRPVLDSLLFAVALAVGLSPELLPAIISVTLAAGARAMAARGVIVRRLEAIENLGSMNILCTDKTGTLTTGTMTLHAALDADGEASADVLQLAYVNAALETGIENPLDEALSAAGTARGLTAEGWRKVGEIPYDFIRRRLTIVVAHGPGPGHLLITKGAVDQILEVCTTVASAGGTRALDGTARAALRGRMEQFGAQGYRVLAVATREMPVRERYGRDDETALTLRGLISFIDPPKEDANATLARLAALGVRTKIVTGDNRHVAAFVAARVGLDPTAILLGEDIDTMTPEAFWQRAELTDLFAEIDPQQKERIVRALQKRGHAVGYLGDGINDAPALHAADVGISVSGAVDVARDSADVLLLKPDLDVLCQGVRDGRRTFANTLKYIGITTSANFGNMLSMALVTPLLPFLPLLAKQILLNNFLSDLPSMAIASDTIDAERTARPTRWNVAELRRYMIVFGLISSVFDLLTFWLLIDAFDAGPAGFQTAWFVVSLLTELAVLLVLRTHGPCWRSPPGRLLWISTALVAAVALALPWTGPAAGLFGLIPLPPPLVATLLAIVAGYVLATEGAKLLFYRVMARTTVGRPQ
jgi:Mg2+-importing ATPase